MSDFQAASPAQKPLAITMGEPAGIGPECILKAWKYFQARNISSQTNPSPAFFYISDPVFIERQSRHLGLDVPISTITSPEEAISVFGSALPVLPVKAKNLAPLEKVVPGTFSAETADCVLSAIRQAVNFAKTQTVSGVVTAPIQKKALSDAGFNFPGHTEYLGALTEEITLPSNMHRGPVMLLAGNTLKVAPVTVHLPVKDIASNLTANNIARTILVVHQALMRDFGIRTPRIVVSGLNPHAGEAGTIGREEIEIITPVIQKFAQQGMQILGPLPSDTMFHEEARAQYHAAITMYHDQGLIPIKALDFHGAVNVTLGLPIIRTSPDHGTGLDIAGKNVARPDSTIQAILYALEMSSKRTEFDKKHFQSTSTF